MPYPPAAPLTVIVPSAAPLHVTLVPAAVADNAAGSIITRLGSTIRTHPVLAASLILTS